MMILDFFISALSFLHSIRYRPFHSKLPFILSVAYMAENGRFNLLMKMYFYSFDISFQFLTDITKDQNCQLQNPIVTMLR